MNYVAGFLFNNKRWTVALIKKLKPEWQKNRLNAVGGKIEEGETPLEAMRREFKEETGADVEEWREFTLLNHSGHQVHFFVAFTDGSVQIKSVTEEQVAWYPIHYLAEEPVIGNLLWLIPLALDPDGLTAVINDNSKPWEK